VTPTTTKRRSTSNDVFQSVLNRVEDIAEQQRMVINNQHELFKKMDYIITKLQAAEPMYHSATSINTANTIGHAHVDNLHTLSNLITQQIMPSSTNATNATIEQQSVQKQKEFDAAAGRFLNALSELSAEEKRAKLESFLQSATGGTADKLTEFFDIFDSSSMRKRLKTSDS
jgi:hypothetical protein